MADWRLKPLTQTYERLDATTYLYRSPAHGFSTRLTTDAAGFVTDYPEGWIAA
ncbi:MAG: putative glycolipid-binding domain-containing protein [Pseudomonadota bacterium]